MKTTSALVLRYLQDVVQREAGQTMAEYGILIAVIALVVIAAAILLGGNLQSLFSSTAGSV